MSEGVEKPSRYKYRLQLFAEMSMGLCSTLFFTKLIVLNHYPRFNAPIKLLCLYIYTATLDPLVVGAGYYLTRKHEHNEAMSASQ